MHLAAGLLHVDQFPVSPSLRFTITRPEKVIRQHSSAVKAFAGRPASTVATSTSPYRGYIRFRPSDRTFDLANGTHAYNGNIDRNTLRFPPFALGQGTQSCIGHKHKAGVAETRLPLAHRLQTGGKAEEIQRPCQPQRLSSAAHHCLEQEWLLRRHTKRRTMDIASPHSCLLHQISVG